MNPVFDSNVVKKELFHKDFNLDKRDNLDELPESPAVFGVFAIIHGTPVHARYVGAADNLRNSVRLVFEEPVSEGLKKFMQGAWCQMLCYQLLPEIPEEERKAWEDDWTHRYKPAVTTDGDYPSYEYAWPYNDNGELKLDSGNSTE